MKISILTLFPQMFGGPFDYSIVKRAKEKGLVEINLVDVRDFGQGRHKTVDDKPYGGGVGMILKVDVLSQAIKATLDPKLKKNEQKVILLTASGKTYKQEAAKSFSRLEHLILICGHYEGIDERISKYIDEELSVGDYVLTGGEIPAMIVTDSVTRLLPGAIAKGATESESFSEDLLEYPQYTRPEIFEGEKVPSVLLSGNHGEIEKWKKEESLRKTKKIRG
jgi:tRNA (guanine37-N1)-methyltransferase